MMRVLLTAIIIAIFSIHSFGQNNDYKFSVCTPWHSFANFGEEKTNTHHYELHFKFQLPSKNKLGIKFATWKLFEPMGIPLWDSHLMQESEFYPGKLHEIGLGLTYQYFICKRLFATIEILPQLKTYYDENNKNIGTGFKLYTSYHIGYYIPLFKNRMYIEPQIHCQYWPVDTDIPPSFKQKEDRWNNYFLFEPNIYIGVNF